MKLKLDENLGARGADRLSEVDRSLCEGMG